ncbi:MAG: sulfurtransferase TusA family protein [Alphaproteobacteria bacterium]|nr:sulfurtransferase TusA family protein [Alphaproteobacteria bacterium]
MADITLDTSGLKCPMPVLRAQKTLRDAPAGTVLTLISTDAVSLKEVPLFCEQAGYALESTSEAEGRYLFRIRSL